MSEKTRKNLLRRVKSMMGDNDLAEALLDMIEEQRGGVGFLLNTLKKRPKTFNPYVLKGISVYGEPSSIDRRTAELIAVGAATALRCEHCIDAHMQRAIDEGATPGEIMDAILISGAITESSALSVAFRRFKLQEGKKKRRRPDKEKQLK